MGTILYYGRSIDNTLLAGLSAISSVQANSTEQTKARLQWLLDYCITHPDARIRYQASQMILYIHSDASYLSEAGAKSRVGGYFYLGDKQDKMLNGAILVISSIIKHVMSSAAEAEVGGLFHNAKEGTIIRTTLQEMGHPQPPTMIYTDNSTANKIANDTCKQQRSRAMDMRYYWLQDRVKQKQFKVHWKPGITNLADYPSKHHAPIHHQRMRPIYLHTKESKWLNTSQLAGRLAPTVRGCVKDPQSLTKGRLSLTGDRHRGSQTGPLSSRYPTANGYLGRQAGDTPANIGISS